MRKNEKININLNYNPCNITKCSFGNIINNTESELFISGINKSKTKIFFHYFSKDLYSNNKKENTFLFQTWNYSPSKIINYIIPINERNIQNQNSGNINYNQTNGVFLFSSKVELLSFNNKEYNQYIIDDEIYIKPTIENDLLYGLISNIGLKIFNLNKKETELIIYPGKKHIINGYINFNDNKNIIFVCEDKKIYIYDKTDKKSFISRKQEMELNLICEASKDYNKFYAYSEEQKNLYLYDIRYINHYIDIIKNDTEITKMKYNKLSSKLYFLEFCSQGIISLDNLKQESIYELNNDIKDFNFQSNFEFMNIISNDNLVNIININ